MNHASANQEDPSFAKSFISFGGVLAIMIASYDEMGLEELRAGAERTLRTNFPDSSLQVETRRTGWWRLW